MGGEGRKQRKIRKQIIKKRQELSPKGRRLTQREVLGLDLSKTLKPISSLKKQLRIRKEKKEFKKFLR